ncbi:MAG: S-layer homology domain-containing protein [Candidatus Gracilibacteria bacterium]
MTAKSKIFLLTLAVLALAVSGVYLATNSEFLQGLLKQKTPVFQAGPEFQKVDPYLDITSQTGDFVDDKISSGANITFKVTGAVDSVDFKVANSDYGYLTIQKAATFNFTDGDIKQPAPSGNDFDTIEMTDVIDEPFVEGNIKDFVDTTDLTQDMTTDTDTTDFTQDLTTDIDTTDFTQTEVQTDGTLDQGLDFTQEKTGSEFLNKIKGKFQGQIDPADGAFDSGNPFQGFLKFNNGGTVNATEVTANKNDKVTFYAANVTADQTDAFTISVNPSSGSPITAQFDLAGSGGGWGIVPDDNLNFGDDDDTGKTKISLSAGKTTIDESGTGSITTLKASLPTGQKASAPIQVNLEFAGDTELGDYEKYPDHDWITISANQQFALMTITAQDDTDSEDETLNVTISSISNTDYEIDPAASSAAITIADDDATVPPDGIGISLFIDKTSIYENGDDAINPTQATLTAKFLDGYTQDSTVNVPLVFSGTSESGDFTTDPSLPFIQILKNENEGQMTVTINSDTDVDDELLTATIGALNTGYIAVDPSTVDLNLIDSDDDPPVGDDDDDDDTTGAICGNSILESGELCDDTNCDITATSSCTSCKASFFLDGNACVATCPTGKYQDGALCVTTCPSGKEIQGGSCVTTVITPPTAISCLDLTLSKPESSWNTDDFTATNSQDFTLAVTTDPAGKASEFKYQWTVTGGESTDWKLGSVTLDPSNTLQNIDSEELAKIKVTALDKTTSVPISSCSLTKTFHGGADGGYTDLDDIDDQELLDAIKWVTDQGIFEGYEDGTFRPFQKIDRVELLKVLLAAYDVPEEEAKLRYKDIDEDAWYVPDLKTGLKNGIFEGDDGKNTARPDDSVNRVESLKMTLEIANIVTDYKPKVCRSIGYDDVYDDQWYYKYTCESYKYGLFDETDDDELSPGQKATRGELALLLYRMFKEGLLDAVID